MADRKEILRLIAKELQRPNLAETDLLSDFFLEEYAVVKMLEKELGIIITDDDLFLKYSLVSEFIDYVLYYR